MLLGDTTLAGMTAIPNSVFANSDVRLRVWFNDGTNGSQLLTPDQRLAAVGYAMVAGSVPDGSITSAKIATGAVTNTQLATNAVQAANIAAGAVGSTEIGNLSIATGNLADSSVTAAKLGSDVGLWSVSGGDVFRSGGNVGIGTDSPSEKLHVTGNAYLEVPASGSQIRALSIDVASFGNVENALNSYFLRVQDSGASSTPFIVRGDGNVGIGTNTPGFPLNFADVNGDKISLYGQSGDSFGFGIQSSLLQIHTGASNADIAFGYGSSAAMTETMRIKGNGNVGIGTNAPRRKAGNFRRHHIPSN